VVVLVVLIGAGLASLQRRILLRSLLDVDSAGLVTALCQLPAHSSQQNGTIALPNLRIPLLQFIEAVARGAQIIFAAASLKRVRFVVHRLPLVLRLRLALRN